MSDDKLELKGIVVDSSNGIFRVQWKTSRGDWSSLGKMKMHKIRVLLGDEVTIELSAYDLSRGRIVRREKSYKNPASPPHLPFLSLPLLPPTRTACLDGKNFQIASVEDPLLILALPTILVFLREADCHS